MGTATDSQQTMSRNSANEHKIDPISKLILRSNFQFTNQRNASRKQEESQVREIDLKKL